MASEEGASYSKNKNAAISVISGISKRLCCLTNNQMARVAREGVKKMFAASSAANIWCGKDDIELSESKMRA